MPDDWVPALDKAIKQTGHADLRRLCDSSHPDHLAWRKQVLQMAGQTLTIPTGRPPNAPPQPPEPAQRVMTGHQTIPQAIARAAGLPGCCNGGPAPPIGQPELLGKLPNQRPMHQELVIARYNEDIGWLYGTPLFATVYNKGQTQPNLSTPHELVPLPNTGREAGTWLHHIITHYDELADWTYFLQGDAKLHQIDVLERLRDDLVGPTCLSTRYKEKEPFRAIKAADKIWQDKQGREMRLGDATTQSHLPNIPIWFNPAAWDYIFTAPRPDPLWFCYTAQWAVPRDSIRIRSLGFYSWLLTVLTENGDETFTDPPINPWSLEALWRYIWMPEYETRVI